MEYFVTDFLTFLQMHIWSLRLSFAFQPQKQQSASQSEFLNAYHIYSFSPNLKYILIGQIYIYLILSSPFLCQNVSRHLAFNIPLLFAVHYIGIIVINPEKLIIQSMFATFLNLFSSKKVEDDEEFIRFTYRSHLQKQYPTTYYESDTGWGCMLRVTQMAIANFLLKKENAKIQTIAPLFWDNSDMPFSIQTFTNISNHIYPHKKPYEWFSPCEAGFLIKRTLENFNTTYSVTVCNDNSLFLSEIPTDKDNVVILIMSRIGLDKPEKDYLQTLTEMMNSKHFFCILGGTPRYAHLFLKQKNGYFGYLDPHETKKCPEQLQEVIESAKESFAKLQWIKKQKICSSMCLMYTCHKSEIGDFWFELTALKQKLGEKFFLYIDQTRPQVNSDDGIIEIIDMEDMKH